MKYRYVVFTLLYLLFALVVDSYIQISQNDFVGARYYLMDLSISALFVLGTLIYLRMSSGDGSKGQKVFVIILSAIILILPILVYPWLPQGIRYWLRPYVFYHALFFPKKHAYIVIASEITLMVAIWKLLPGRNKLDS